MQEMQGGEGEMNKETNKEDNVVLFLVWLSGLFFGAAIILLILYIFGVVG
jgi:hypothetical protein